MKPLRPLLQSLGLALIVSTATALAGTDINGDSKDMKDLRHPILDQNIHSDPLYFRANEWQVDLFGAYAVAGNGAINSGGGGGVGVNYFFTRYFGVGVDASGFDGGSTVDTVSAANLNFIARYPLERFHLAPYAFAGAGGNLMTGDTQVVGDVGGGHTNGL